MGEMSLTYSLITEAGERSGPAGAHRTLARPRPRRTSTLPLTLTSARPPTRAWEMARTVVAPPSSVVKRLWGVVWGFGGLFLSCVCVCVCVGGVVLCRCVCVCVCDLLIFLQRQALTAGEGRKPWRLARGGGAGGWYLYQKRNGGVGWRPPYIYNIYIYIYMYTYMYIYIYIYVYIIYINTHTHTPKHRDTHTLTFFLFVWLSQTHTHTHTHRD